MMKPKLKIEQLNDYNNSALNLKKLGLVDLPDNGICIRASQKGLELGKELLESFILLDKYNETVGRK